MGQELERRRQHDVVAEQDPRHGQDGREQHEPAHTALRLLVERGREERPDLPEQKRGDDHQRRVERHAQRGQKRLRHPERDRVTLRRRQRLVQPDDKPMMEPIGNRQRDREREQRKDDPAPQLIEMLDKRRLLAMLQAPR